MIKITYKCDRCSAEFYQDTLPKVHHIAYDTDGSRLDLCSECLDALMHFLKGALTGEINLVRGVINENTD